MSTDESMDARLRDAGAQWRAANDAAPAAHVPLESALESAPVEDVSPAPAVHDLTEARRRRNRWALLSTAAAVVLIGGVATALVVTSDGGNTRRDTGVAGGPESALTSTQWRLVSITDGDGKAVPVSGDASLVIKDGQLGGSDGCNHIGGRVTVGDSTLSLPEGLATTDMACLDPDVTATAAAVDKFLRSDITYSIDGDLLILTRAGAGHLVYRGTPVAQPSSNPDDLLGTWALSSIGHETTTPNGSSGSGGDGVASGGSNYDAIQISFDGKGGIVIKHQCYTNKGNVDAGGGTMTVSDVTLALAIPCTSTAAEELKSENETVDNVLAGQLTWVIDNGQLTISKETSPTEKTELQFKQVSAEPIAIATDTPVSNAPDEIVGTWTLQSYTTSGGKNATTTSPVPAYRVTFTGDGKVTFSDLEGFEYQGTYTVDGQSLTTTLNVQAKPGCAAEEQVVRGLSSGPFWRVDAGVLTLALGDSLGLDFVKGTTSTDGAELGC